MLYCARCWVSQWARRRQADECRPPRLGQGLMPYRRRSAHTQVTRTSHVQAGTWQSAHV